MRLAISNIAWDFGHESALLPRLAKLGVQGIEVAPTKRWPNWVGITHSSAIEYKETLLANNLVVPAFQALLFGRPDLQLFETDTHRAFLEHIELVAELASWMNAKALVFGSPKNRIKGVLSTVEADSIAVDFFSRAAAICVDHGVVLAIEANPVEYGCDYITTTQQARNLVDQVNHTGFRLHFDSGALHMSGDDVATAIGETVPYAHCHVSEPYLSPLLGGVVAHEQISIALKNCGYDGWVSIEMKTIEDIDVIESSVKIGSRAYCGN